MAFTPFNAVLGIRQGRMDPNGFVPTTGDYAYVLGSDLSGEMYDFNIGDYSEVNQDIDLTEVNFIRAQVKLRNALEIPQGVNWEASITVGGEKKTTMKIKPGRSRDRSDMAANVSKLTGVYIVGLRLELIAD